MKFKQVLKNKDVGAIGIGAMIVFIAMVLVAGIAASVLVQTANKLEIQAMETGDQTTAEVSTGIRVSDIEGQKATAWQYSGTSWANNTLTNLTIMVAPRAGSSDIDLSQVVIEISDTNRKCILTYIGTTTDPNFAGAIETTGVFATTDDETADKMLAQNANSFGIMELEDADGSCSEENPVINRGDKVMLTINLTACFSGGGVSERTDVWGMIIPEEGAAGFFGFRTPASYTDEVFDLY